MNHTSPQFLLNALIELETLIPALAQREIMPRFNQIGFSYKQDGSVVTEADTAMQKSVVDALTARWPQFRLLGEEMSAAQQQALLSTKGEGLWVLDPLDGTSNFASGIPIFSVSLALIQDGEVQLGMIYDPVRQECFAAIRGQGARLNGQPLHVHESRVRLDQCIAQVDLKRLPSAMATKIAAQHPFASQRNFGSGALDWGWLAAGRSQLYVHGGQKLWDYLAGQLILHEAGGMARTFERAPVFAPVLKPRSVMAAVSPALFEAWSAWLLSS
jgi:myo-inositol-1(or 4)-monophosphatase